MFEPTACLVAALICFPALLFGLRGSSWLVDYLFFVVALNRGIRASSIIKWIFNPYSMISLTPIIVGGIAALVVVKQLNESHFGEIPLKRLLDTG